MNSWLRQPPPPTPPRQPDDRAELVARIKKLEDHISALDKHCTLGFWSTLDRIYEQNLRGRVLRCTVCHRENVREGFETLTAACIFGGGNLERYRCPNCDTVFGAMKFLDQPPEMIERDYRLIYTTYKESNSTIIEKRTFNMLNPERGNVYVNWGCGAWNTTVPELRAEGWDVWGYEPTSAASSEFIITRKDDLPKNIAGIFSHNVIEHFLDPLMQFAEFHALLVPGGRMAHSSPCYEYRFEYTRFHTYFPLGRSPIVLAEKSGFRHLEQITDSNDPLYGCALFERV